MSNVINIAPHEVAAKMKAEQGELIDVRTATEFEAGYIANAQNIDFLSGEFAETIPSLDKSKTYYLYCRSGGRSGKSAELLLAAGFTKVYNIGGFDSLANAGLPVEY
jgi:phage shock protein E